MKVSIVTPFHNAESTISETAESVFRQNYSNWEWLLFNDASSDKSIQLIEQLQSKDSRIRVIGETKRSMGPSYGRNLGIAQASGEIVALLDADDLWQPDYLERRLEAYEKFPEVGMIYGPAIIFGKNQEFIQDTGINDSKLFEPGELILPFMRNIKGTPCTSGVTINRQISENEIAFPQNLRRGEDIAFFLLVNEHFSVFYDSTPTFRYRRHQASSTSKAQQAGLIHQMDWPFYKWLLSFSHNIGSNKISKQGNKIYYEHLYAAIRDLHAGYIKSRKGIYQHLTEEDLPRIFFLFFLLDCLTPLKFSKKIRTRIYKIINY
jgi:glycosyltransferase involved in cell wall biosynthesis